MPHIGLSTSRPAAGWWSMAECLPDLIATLETATGPSRELDERMAVEVFGSTYDARMACNRPWLAPRGRRHRDTVPAYTRSLDAITGACEQRWPLPGWQWSVEAVGAAVIWDEPNFKRIYAEHKQGLPAMALCLAAARLALAEQEVG